MSKRRTWVDFAIRAAGVLTIILLAYLGYAMWQQKIYREQTSPAGRAVVNLEKVVRTTPNDPGARVRLAQAYIAANRLDDAVQQYNDALKLRKDFPDALVGLGLLAMDQKNWSVAEAQWRRVIDTLDTGEFAQKDDRLEAGYFYMGTALMEEHKYEDAISYLKQASRIRPDASDTHYALSVAYDKLNLSQKREQELKIALAFEPTMPEANYDYGLVLLKQGKTADAAERFRLSADKAPNIDKPRIALEKLGTAEDHIKKALKLAGSNVASATIEARIAVAIDPADTQALRALGQLYEKQNKRDLALKHYQKALKLDPNDKDAADAVARLTRKK